MKYKNISSFEIKAHGVTFKPGDIKESDYILNPKFFILVHDESENRNQSKPSTSRTRKVQKTSEPNISTKSETQSTKSSGDLNIDKDEIKTKESE